MRYNVLMLLALIDSEYLRLPQTVTLIIHGLSSHVLKAGNLYNMLLSIEQVVGSLTMCDDRVLFMGV